MTSPILGHVEMSVERYNSLNFDQRTRAWNELVKRLKIPGDVIWLPISYQDTKRMVVGMNIVMVGRVGERDSA